MMSAQIQPHHAQQAAIAALFRGQLEAAAHQDLHRHLAGCVECRRVYERYAAAERALSPKAELSPLMEDRVAARLFSGQEARAPRRSAAPLWVALATAAGLSMVVLMPRPSDELTARSGERVSAQVGLRALGIGHHGQDLAVSDLEGNPVLPGQRVQVLATSFDRERYARAWLVQGDGRVVAASEILRLAPGEEDQTLASFELGADVPEGELTVVAAYAADAGGLAAPPAERSAVDGADRAVRVIRGRVARAEVR